MDLVCPKCLSVIVATQFVTKEQQKDLTHMFCLQIPYYKLYKEGLFSHILTIIYKCHFGMRSKKINLKAKHDFSNKKFMDIL